MEENKDKITEKEKSGIKEKVDNKDRMYKIIIGVLVVAILIITIAYLKSINKPLIDEKNSIEIASTDDKVPTKDKSDKEVESEDMAGNESKERETSKDKFDREAEEKEEYGNYQRELYDQQRGEIDLIMSKGASTFEDGFGNTIIKEGNGDYAITYPDPLEDINEVEVSGRYDYRRSWVKEDGGNYVHQDRDNRMEIEASHYLLKKDSDVYNILMTLKLNHITEEWDSETGDNQFIHSSALKQVGPGFFLRLRSKEGRKIIFPEDICNGYGEDDSEISLDRRNKDCIYYKPHEKKYDDLAEAKNYQIGEMLFRVSEEDLLNYEIIELVYTVDGEEETKGLALENIDKI